MLLDRAARQLSVIHFNTITLAQMALGIPLLMLSHCDYLRALSSALFVACLLASWLACLLPRLTLLWRVAELPSGSGGILLGCGNAIG